jgi:DNA-binding LacI/PurR family transcriptional regulator
MNRSSAPDAVARPKRATSYDVARAAGVAQSTVSRCFQEDSNISRETREKVLKVAARLGYARNAVARSLITQKSNMVAVIATRFTIRNNPEVVFILSEALRKHGMSLLLIVVQNDAAVAGSLQEALEYPLDGIIACAEIEPADAERFARRGVPIVFFNRQVDLGHTDCIGTDHANGARRLAEMLVAAGHRRFLCIGGPEGAPVSRARTEAFLARLAALGVTDVTCAEGNFSYESGREVFVAAVEGRRRPDAVFCANDQLAMGVMDGCRFDLGWRVPEDVSVVGFDDVPEAARPTYDLTTVHQHIEPMAERAVEMLRARMSEPDRPGENVLIAGSLILRSSARLGSG